MFRYLPFLAVAACSPKTVPPESTETEPAAQPAPPPSAPVLDMEPPAHDSETVVQMHAWLQSAETARTHLTRGDLDAAKQAAASMAASPSPAKIPEGWRPFAVDLLAEASAMAAAESVDAAGGHLGNMGLACGTCHTEAGVLEQVATVVLPPEMYNEDMRMENHQWASDWMWFGLVTANEDAYRLGASTFSSTSLPPPEQSVSGTGLMPLLDDLRAVAGHAALSETDGDRAANYGKLLASCAACHSQPMVE